MGDETASDDRNLTVGQVARRCGIAVSALHFYEREGLITSTRTPGNQRRYSRETLRRIALIRVAQRVGIPLADIRAALDQLPGGRMPTPRDWRRVAASWQDELNARIRHLEQLRDSFTDCIGCGCLSIDACKLANPHDILANEGPGPRRLLRPHASAPLEPMGDAQREDCQRANATLLGREEGPDGAL